MKRTLLALMVGAFMILMFAACSSSTATPMKPLESYRIDMTPVVGANDEPMAPIESYAIDFSAPISNANDEPMAPIESYAIDFSAPISSASDEPMAPIESYAVDFSAPISSANDEPMASLESFIPWKAFNTEAARVAMENYKPIMCVPELANF